jgi:hypothetical protein
MISDTFTIMYYYYYVWTLSLVACKQWRVHKNVTGRARYRNIILTYHIF